MEERDEAAELVAALALLGVLVAIEKAAPHVREWMKDSAVPAMKASRERLARAVRRGRRPKDTQLAVVVEAASEDTSPSIEIAPAPQVTMSSAEWQERFRVMLLAGAFQEEQWRLLSSARVVGDDELREVQGAMANLSPEQVAEGMRLALEGSAESLDPRLAAQLTEDFAGIRVRELPPNDRPA